MSTFEDTTKDKVEICLEFVLEKLSLHRKSFEHSHQQVPLFVGLNGVQGCGKTTIAETLAQRLNQIKTSPVTVVLSIDDLYLPYGLQVELAANHPNNPLIQHRGQPSTHDLPLALSLLTDLSQGKPVKLPSYDKSARNAKGDRAPENTWKTANDEGQPPTQIVILEGWCVGFRALETEELERKWSAAVARKESDGYQGRLGFNKLDDMMFINNALRAYDQITNRLDLLIQLDAEDTLLVYPWRLEQEVRLREKKGSSMTDAQVKEFVDGYYPAYELYTDRLREGAFGEEQDKQLRLIIGRNRELIKASRI